ncbi:uncharacterized protein METZ01_LOCUS406346, partial [marine metagenome]
MIGALRDFGNAPKTLRKVLSSRY